MTNVPSDGRITSFPLFAGPFTGTEVTYIVSPGNAQFGQSFQVSIQTMAQYLSASPSVNRTVITAGATYNALISDTQIFVNKTIGSPTGILLPTAGSMLYQGALLFKDTKGDAATNNITITFSGGQLCDNQASVVIDTNYGYTWLTPSPGVSAGAAGWGVVG
jgi:hypothetical protein